LSPLPICGNVLQFFYHPPSGRYGYGVGSPPSRWVHRVALFIRPGLAVQSICLFKCYFCRAMLCVSAAYAVQWCGVRLCVCLPRSWILSKREIVFSKFFHHRVAKPRHSFHYHTAWRYSEGNTLTGGVECRWGRHKSRSSWYNWLSIDDVLDLLTTATIHRAVYHTYATQQWIYINFITACSMHDYDELRRTEQYAAINLKQNLRSIYRTIEANNRHGASRGLFATAEILVYFFTYFILYIFLHHFTYFIFWQLEGICPSEVV